MLKMKFTYANMYPYPPLHNANDTFWKKHESICELNEELCNRHHIPNEQLPHLPKCLSSKFNH